MNICPLNKQKCNESACPLVIKLDDFVGCPFDLAEKAVQYMKINTLLPAALKLDKLAKKYLSGGD